MIVRTSDMTLVVSDIREQLLDKIAKLAEDSQGYVVSSKPVEGQSVHSSGRSQFGCPREQFDNAMSTLRGMAVEVTSENTSAQDVTEEYTDLNASTLTNLEATEAQLLEIMTKAGHRRGYSGSTRTAHEHRRVRLRALKGRMQYLEQTSATSLINGIADRI